MTWGTVSLREVLLLVIAAAGLVIHARGLRASLGDRRELEARGWNGARRLLVRGHIRGHALRLLVNVVVILMAAYLMTRVAPATDRTAPVVIGGLLVISLTLLADGLLDARDWRALEEE